MTTELPNDLRHAVDRRLKDVAARELGRVTAELSSRYRGGAGTGAPIARSTSEVLAYAAYRLPATYAAIGAALLAVRQQRPGWSPRTMLDLGAGLGAGLWGAVGVWASLERITAVDGSTQMISVGRDFAGSAAHPAVRSAGWIHADLGGPWPSDPCDLVLVSYVLGELDPLAVDEIVGRAWAATSGTVVVVEPGTPPGYARVIRARDRLLADRGFTTAPCPHDAACPLVGGDWCHFSVRLARTRTHRAAKQATLGYEDEKFSYVAVSREPTGRATARVLRHPQIRPGRIHLELCTREGLKTSTVSKRNKDVYRRARKIAWGDSFDPSDE